LDTGIHVVYNSCSGIQPESPTRKNRPKGPTSLILNEKVIHLEPYVSSMTQSITFENVCWLIALENCFLIGARSAKVVESPRNRPFREIYTRTNQPRYRKSDRIVTLSRVVTQTRIGGPGDPSV
jgi:hypothetical protein